MIGTGIVAGAFMDMIGTGTAHAGKKSIIRKRAVWLEVIGWILVGCWTFYILFLFGMGHGGCMIRLHRFAECCYTQLFSISHSGFLGESFWCCLLNRSGSLSRLIVSIVRQVIRFIVKVIVVLFTPFVKLFRIISRKLFKRRVK